MRRRTDDAAISQNHGATARPLQGMVQRSTLVTAAIMIPAAILAQLLNHSDIGRGLLVGALLGIANSLLLARRLDNMITGREQWQKLRAVAFQNMMLRFTIVLGTCAVALKTSHIHPLGLVVGLAGFMVVGSIVNSRDIMRRWRVEGGMLV